MISFSKILVGVDLSHADRLISHEINDPCKQAIQKGIELAKAGGGTMTILTAINISEQALHLIQSDNSGKKSAVEKEAEEVLEQLAEQARSAGVTVDVQVKFGPGADSIVRYANENDYTLVIVGRKKKSSFSEFFFGRTAIKLLRNCPIPLYIAKPDPPRAVESILAADDFSDVGEDILDASVQLARMLNTRLHVVHVVESEDDYKLAGSGISKDDLDSIRDKQLEEAETTANERLSQTDYRTIELGSMVHIEKGSAEKAIGELLKEHEVDLLVMGTIGRSGISAMIMGNTAERILAEMDCSLLAIKPRDFVCPVK